MRRKLIKTVLIVHFSKASRRPFLQATLRIIGSFCIAVVIANKLRLTMASVSLPPGIPLDIALVVTALLGFMMAGLLLLTLQISGVTNSRGGALTSNMRLWPIPANQRWALDILPPFVLLSIIGVFGSILLAPVASDMLLPSIWVVMSWVIGLASALGLTKLTIPRSTLLRSILFVSISFAGFRIVDLVLTGTNLWVEHYGILIVAILLFLPVTGLWQSYNKGYLLVAQKQRVDFKPFFDRYVPLSAWHFVKLFRNKRTRHSFILALGFNLVVALAILAKNTIPGDPSGILMIGGVLAATFACDVRGIVRRSKPPEIILLGTVKYFVKSEIMSVTLLGLIIGLPLLFVINHMIIVSPMLVLYFVSLQIFSSGCGLLSSTLLVPGDGEVGSQFFTAVLALSGIVAVLKFADIADVSDFSQSLRWLLSSIAAYIGLFIIEKFRRSYYGRT